MTQRGVPPREAKVLPCNYTATESARSLHQGSRRRSALKSPAWRTHSCLDTSRKALAVDLLLLWYLLLRLCSCAVATILLSNFRSKPCSRQWNSIWTDVRRMTLYCRRLSGRRTANASAKQSQTEWCNRHRSGHQLSTVYLARACYWTILVTSLHHCWSPRCHQF